MDWSMARAIILAEGFLGKDLGKKIGREWVGERGERSGEAA